MNFLYCMGIEETVQVGAQSGRTDIRTKNVNGLPDSQKIIPKLSGKNYLLRDYSCIV